MVRDAPGQPPRDAPHNLYGLGPTLLRARRRPEAAARRCSSTPRPACRRRPAPTSVNRSRACTSGCSPGTTRPTRGTPPRARGSASSTASRTVVVGGGQIAPTNVVVQFTQLRRASSNGQTLGEGDVLGLHRRRASARAGGCGPTTSSRRSYVDANGQPDPAAPGPHLGRAPARRRTRSTSSRRHRQRPRSLPRPRRLRPTTKPKKTNRLAPVVVGMAEPTTTGSEPRTDRLRARTENRHRPRQARARRDAPRRRDHGRRHPRAGQDRRGRRRGRGDGARAGARRHPARRRRRPHERPRDDRGDPGRGHRSR